MALFAATGATLLGALLLAAMIRDVEARPCADGDPRCREPRDVLRLQARCTYKLFVWTLSAVLCGFAGALYVPQVGIINPSEMSPANSIEIAIWTAVGGRGTLIGPVVGALRRHGAKSWFTVAFPEYWLFFLGLLFILVTLFLPRGVIGLLRRRDERRFGGASMNTEVMRTADGGLSGFAEAGMRVAGTDVDTTHGPILYLDGITVSFDGFKALNDLSLTIDDGELRCIIGPNGAGRRR
jgi:MFS family permease